MPSRLIDLSRPLRPATPPWPGDRGVTFDQPVRIRDGASCNVGHLALSVHNGTHADAPYHYNDAGKTIDVVPLETYLGLAWVVDARGQTALTRGTFAGLDFARAPRVLLRTGVWTDPDQFPSSWPVLEPGVPAWLRAAGVILIGVDAPSVDHLTSRTLDNHHALDKTGILILENLDLDLAPTGCHDLIALPLRIAGGDGSPIRAVLRVSD